MPYVEHVRCNRKLLQASLTAGRSCLGHDKSKAAWSVVLHKRGVQGIPHEN